MFFKGDASVLEASFFDRECYIVNDKMLKDYVPKECDFKSMTTLCYAGGVKPEEKEMIGRRGLSVCIIEKLSKRGAGWSTVHFTLKTSIILFCSSPHCCNFA